GFMRILVTGGAGFIGSHLTEALLAAGTHEVSVLDDLSAGKRDRLDSKAQFHHADIRNADEIRMIVGRVKPEVIVHLAAQMDVRRSVAEPSFDAEVNLIGLINLMEAGRVNGLRRVIF